MTESFEQSLNQSNFPKFFVIDFDKCSTAFRLERIRHIRIVFTSKMIHQTMSLIDNFFKKKKKDLIERRKRRLVVKNKLKKIDF